MKDYSELKMLAEATTPQDFDSAQVATHEGWIECPTCGGEGSVDLGGDYLNYDNEALGVQFYGIGDAHVKAEDYYRAANPAAVLALIAEVECLRAQHGRDSKELRSLCQARDDARKDRDQLKEEVERSTEREIMQLAEIEALRRDAERYRWLRKQNWFDSDIAVVRSPNESIKIGYDCPSTERLDDYIDNEMKESKS